jgi:peptide/nickel transport system permease protein
MPIDYALRRIGVFFVIVWAAATVNFLIPRLAPGNPIRDALVQQLTAGGGGAGVQVEEVVAAYEARFGLDLPLWQQYFNYLWDTVRFNFGVSITRFPTPVWDSISDALPWTLILVATATLIAFVSGSLFGALLAWPRAPRFIHGVAPAILTMAAVPYYLLGLILIYIFAFRLGWFPLGGGHQLGTSPSFTVDFIRDAVYHSVLPAMSLILATLGFWALQMRGMMVTVQGEDYVTLAEAKGLRPRRIFFRYALRNAMLPQLTALALALGHVVSGAVLVEIVFGYPGIGTLLFQSVRNFDYPVIYAITFLIIVAIGLATLILDMLLPVLDPRIKYSRD